MLNLAWGVTPHKKKRSEGSLAVCCFQCKLASQTLVLWVITGQKSELVSLWIHFSWTIRSLVPFGCRRDEAVPSNPGILIVKIVMLEDATKPFLAIIFPLDKF